MLKQTSQYSCLIPDARRLIPVILFSVVCLYCSCQQQKPVSFDLTYKPNGVELFGPNIISTSLYERDMAISEKGDEIIFTLGDYSQSKRCLVAIKKTGNTWGKKHILSFSGKYNDIEPCLSYDGKKLYFASDRPVENISTKKNYNIWVTERSGTGWSSPAPLPSTINTENDEFYPSVTRNNNLYFTSVRKNGFGSEDILLSKYTDGKYSDPEPLDTCINSKYDEFNAYVSPDENLIIFSSYGRKDDIGGGDLYYSKKDNAGKWTSAVNMGPGINSDKIDYCPFIDLPRGNFYFTSERILPGGKRIEEVSELEEYSRGILNGMGNIYRINVDKIIKGE
jgi:hypothetical protein